MYNSKNYKNTDVETADRGKLIILLYDHCIKWCKVAGEAAKTNNVEVRTKAIFKVQDAITELQCSLDHDKGGQISKNLFSLYDFYNRHLSDANVKNDPQYILDVQNMLQELRTAWIECISTVRKDDSFDFGFKASQKSYVSLVG